jgi:drug/metabolite transporter (DMT)-like permease
MAEWINDLSPQTKALIQGQWISVLIAGTGIFATILSDTHPSTSFPLLMSSCNYLLLATYMVRKYILRKPGERKSVTEPKGEVEDGMSRSSHSTSSTLDEEPNLPDSMIYWYIFAAVLDVEANYLVILAYNYTTITSVMLLDCFTIPCAMVLSYLFLGCRYNYMHILGTAICLLGLACIVINDSAMVGDDDAAAGSNPVLGDVLCLCGAVLYASSNVLQEHLVKFHDREQFLGHLGCFGFAIAAVQCAIVDLPRMRRAHFTGKVVGATSGFVVCLFLMYTNTTAFLQHGDAVLFNLSLLTSDVYAVVFSYFFSGYFVGWLYFVAFALVIVGLLLYHSQPRPLHIGRDFGDVGLFETMQRDPVRRGSACSALGGRSSHSKEAPEELQGGEAEWGRSGRTGRSFSSSDTGASSSGLGSPVHSGVGRAQYNPLSSEDDGLR